MEYKVLTKEDRRWSGKFSPESMEHTLNSYAAEGWRVEVKHHPAQDNCRWALPELSKMCETP